ARSLPFAGQGIVAMSRRGVFLAVLIFSAAGRHSYAHLCPSNDSRTDVCAHHHWKGMRLTQLSRLAQLLSAERNLAAMDPRIGNQVSAQMAAATALASN